MKHRTAIDEGGNNVPCIMKKLGKPGTVVPRYAVGPLCVSLYSFNVPVVPCTFKEYSSYERYSVYVKVSFAQPNSTYSHESCGTYYHIKVNLFS